jgi:hypothetical protein
MSMGIAPPDQRHPANVDGLFNRRKTVGGISVLECKTGSQKDFANL